MMANAFTVLLLLLCCYLYYYYYYAYYYYHCYFILINNSLIFVLLLLFFMKPHTLVLFVSAERVSQQVKAHLQPLKEAVSQRLYLSRKVVWCLQL